MTWFQEKDIVEKLASDHLAVDWEKSFQVIFTQFQVTLISSCQNGPVALFQEKDIVY